MFSFRFDTQQTFTFVYTAPAVATGVSSVVITLSSSTLYDVLLPAPVTIATGPYPCSFTPPAFATAGNCSATMPSGTSCRVAMRERILQRSLGRNEWYRVLQWRHLSRNMHAFGLCGACTAKW